MKPFKTTPFKTRLRTLIFALGISGGLISLDAIASQPDTTTASQHAACACFDVTVVGNGPAVILIPGLASSGAVWQATVDQLKDEYQLHVLTLAGFAGVAPLPADMLSKGFLQAQLQAVLRYISDRQLDKPAIIGHSLGGYLAMALAVTAPEQIGAVINVDGLPAMGALFTPEATQAPQEAAPVDFDPITIAKGMANNETWHQRIINDMFRSDGMTSGQVMGELMRADLRPELSALAVPVLTIGALQNGAPFVAAEQVQANYETQFESTPTQYHSFAFAADSRHFIMADAPQWLNQQIEQFLLINASGSQ